MYSLLLFLLEVYFAIVIFFYGFIFIFVFVYYIYSSGEILYLNVVIRMVRE